MLESLYKKYDNVIYFDTETTGLDYQVNQIIELSFIPTNINNLDINIPVQDIFIHAQIPDEITVLTGITQEKLDQDGIDEEDAVKKFAKFIPLDKNNLLVAHNAQFDIAFLRSAFERYGLENYVDNCHYLDTLTIYKDRRAYPHKLSDAIEDYDLRNVQNSHLASDDTQALFEFCKALSLERDDLARYINLFGFNPKYGEPQPKLCNVFYVGQKYRNNMANQNEILPAQVGRFSSPIPENIHIKGETLPLKETRVAIFGEVTNYEFFKGKMENLFPSKHITIVSGDSNKGIDVMSSDLAKDWGVKLAAFPAEWKRYKRKAGHVRNAHMIKYTAEANGYFVTFGPNTALKKQAERKGLKVIEI